MAATAHTLSSSDESGDDFNVGPDLATRLKARLVPQATKVRGCQQTATDPATRPVSHDASNRTKRVAQEVEIISSDEEQEQRTSNKENEEDVTFVSEVKSPAVVDREGRGGAGVGLKRPRVAGYDSTTEEEDDLPDVQPISPIHHLVDGGDGNQCHLSDGVGNELSDGSNGGESSSCRDGEQQQSSQGQRWGVYQPALTAPVFGRAAVQSSWPPPSQTIQSPSPPPLSKAEAKKREAEKRRQERERLKRERLQEKERAKEMKELEKVAKKANSITECTKWLAVRASGRLCSSSAGTQLAGTVSASNLQWGLHHDPIVAEAVTFVRVDPRTRQETAEALAIVVLDSDPFLTLVHNQSSPSDNHTANYSSSAGSVGHTLSGRTVVDTGLSGPQNIHYNCTLEEQCRTWKELLGVENIILFIWGLDEHFKKKKACKANNRGRKGRGKDDRPEPNRLDVEMALTTVQVMQRVDHRFFSDALQLAEYVVHLAKAVAQAPYKREQQDDGAMFSSWYAEGSNVAPVKVTASGVGLRKLWQQQLRQFTSVGLETAQAIADAYPSPSLLLEAYESLSSEAGSRLLADIPVRRGAGPLQTTRRLGPELSKKVHTFFTSTNPDRVLGS